MNQSLSLVGGLGKTGLSIVRYLHRKNKPFIVFDTRKEAPGLTELKQEFPEVDVYLETLPDEVLASVTEIISSPGLSMDTPFIQKALKKGIPVYGDIECLAQEITAPVIAITGTNGKSTVTALVGEMGIAAGFSTAIAGNIGTPVLDLLDEKNTFDLWVLELSSFQLDLIYSLSPIVATILNLTPDHLDRHHTLEAYTQAKQRIYQRAKLALFNREDSYTIPQLKEQIPACSFGKNSPTDDDWGLITQGQNIYLAKGAETFFPVESLRIKGVHNWLNALAACALADAAGISFDAIRHVLKNFPGLPHRCQWVRTLNGVDWINDSKGTNVGATLSAINGIGSCLQGKIVLIAGGQGKGADFSDLAQPVASFARSVVLIGEDAPQLEKALANAAPIMYAESLEQAVHQAQISAQPGDVVLLSPACASFDMFRDFNHRGEVFMSVVNGL